MEGRFFSFTHIVLPVSITYTPEKTHSDGSSSSLLLDMQIYSPSVQMVKLPGLEASQSRPVFCGEDKVEGKIVLDPSCSQNGRLTISVCFLYLRSFSRLIEDQLEGTFEYSSVRNNPGDAYPGNLTVGKHRHVFLSSSATIPISSVAEPRSTIREALSVRKRPSTSSLNSLVCRSCEFSFELPRPGAELPPTFSPKTLPRDLRRQLRTEELEVAYRITAVWEASDGSQPKAMYVDGKHAR